MEILVMAIDGWRFCRASTGSKPCWSLTKIRSEATKCLVASSFNFIGKSDLSVGMRSIELRPSTARETRGGKFQLRQGIMLNFPYDGYE